MLKPKREEKIEKQRPRLLTTRHRLHRSSVRPFFCCGSQLSLNSITELKDVPLEKEKTSEDDYEDLTDSDDLADDTELRNIAVSHSSIKSEPSTSRSTINKRKKTHILHDKPNGRKKFWTVKLRGKLPLSKRSHYSSESKLSSGAMDSGDLCVCTSYKANGAEGSETGALLTGGRVSVPVSVVAHLLPTATSSSQIGATGSSTSSDEQGAVGTSSRARPLSNMPLQVIENFNILYPTNDIDDQLIRQRRYEMEFGVLEVENGTSEEVWVKNEECIHESSQENESKGQYPSYGAMGLLAQDPTCSSEVSFSLESNRLMLSTLSLNANSWVSNVPRLQGVHTQVDYKHHLVPDMERIVNSSFYWGVMDRYQAEKLIENKPEGTFLLRDSAQDEFLFSVSFRRYGRSLHARIEQWNHKFSFDCRDPGVFSTDSVCGLIEHYKDPSCCMFFEPMLTLPLHRNFPFSLQHMVRATISSRVTYDGINQLPLPASLKEYLRFYHYKQKVRMRRFDNMA